MATEVYKFIGQAYWAKVYEPDSFMGKLQFKLQLHLENDVEWKKFEDSGVQKTVKENENGKFVEFTRDANKLIKGNLVFFTGPIVEDADGGVIVDFIRKSTGKRVYSYEQIDKADIVRRGAPILIGNGSRVQVEVAVYDTMKGKGQRLEKVRILDLIEYERGGGELPKMSNLLKEEQLVIKEEVETTKTPW